MRDDSTQGKVNLPNDSGFSFLFGCLHVASGKARRSKGDFFCCLYGTIFIADGVKVILQ